MNFFGQKLEKTKQMLSVVGQTREKKYEPDFTENLIWG